MIKKKKKEYEEDEDEDEVANEESFQGSQGLHAEAPLSHPSFVTRPTPMKVIEAPTIGTTSISQQKKGSILTLSNANLMKK